MKDKTFNLLFAFCVFSILILSSVSAGSGSFYISNKSASTQSYFFVNGTTGNVEWINLIDYPIIVEYLNNSSDNTIKW